MKLAPPLILLLFFCLADSLIAQAARQYYFLEDYSYSNPDQEGLIDFYMEEALVPALKRNGITSIGVFKDRPGDSNPDSLRHVYVLYPLSSLDKIARLDESLLKDELYQKTAAPFLGAPYDSPAFYKLTTTVMKAFKGMPVMKQPALEGPRKDRIYELRSYESPTPDLYRNKLHMFNEGGEITLFERLGFNAVFYGEVISGARMPNLIYMTTFEDRQTRDQRWKEFVDSETWKELERDPKYQHNVNKADIMLLYPTPYSDY
ncbi:NIPSNAP family protein [Zeaxanthinibacter enoshimensis]|uniref:NIPSNAP family protein n=1 Tax=Zeaxanthinibacter enoshimensis TaxID=392009 RepID=UPI0035679D00